MGPGALTQRDRQNIERMTRPEPNEVIQDEQVRRIRQGGSRGGRSRVALLHARLAEGPNRLLDAMNTLHQTRRGSRGRRPRSGGPVDA